MGRKIVNHTGINSEFLLAYFERILNKEYLFRVLKRRGGMNVRDFQLLSVPISNDHSLSIHENMKN